MASEIVTAQGYERDIAAITEGKAVLLHRWVGGHILLMVYDPHMPDWSATSVESASLEGIQERLFGSTQAERYATGYVFWVCEKSPKGHLELEGKRYTQLEIYDYVLWTDEQQVRQKYDEVVARARREK